MTDWFRVEVLRTARVTPRMIRVTLGGPDLHEYRASGEPDEYCTVLFPRPGEAEPAIPVENGHVSEGTDTAPRRTYTIRRLDRAAGELDIDFVAHEGGVAAEWALRAAPGDRVALTAAGGKFRLPPAGHWLALLGDATALPAIGRIVEALEPGRRAVVIAVVADVGEEQSFESAGELTVCWVHAGSRRAGSALVAAARGLRPPDGPGFIWLSGEAEAARAVRKYLRHELGLPSGSYATMGYWRHRREEWDLRYRRVAADIEPRVEAADKAIADDEEFFDELDRIYDEVGL
jgi:NADPH-dependent ferric siderophore reductase